MPEPWNERLDRELDVPLRPLALAWLAALAVAWVPAPTQARDTDAEPMAPAPTPAPALKPAAKPPAKPPAKPATSAQPAAKPAAAGPAVKAPAAPPAAKPAAKAPAAPPSAVDLEELAEATARFDKAFSAYTKLATSGGLGNLPALLKEYQSAHKALEDVKVRHAAKRAAAQAAAQGPAQGPVQGPAQAGHAAPKAGQAAAATPTASAPTASAPTAGAPTAGAPSGVGAPPQGAVAVSLAPFNDFRLDRLAEEARRDDPRLPWSVPGSGATPPDVRALGSYRGTLTEAMNRLQVLQGKAPAPVLDAHAAAWAPLYGFPTAQNQQYFGQLVPALDETIAAGVELEELAPALQDSLVDVAAAAATGDGRATRVALRAAAAKAALVERSRQKLQGAAQRVRQLGDPQNPLAAQQAARELHRAALHAKPAATPPPTPPPAAPGDADCRSPFGDCKVTNIKMVSTAPRPGQTIVIPNVPIAPTPYSGPPEHAPAPAPAPAPTPSGPPVTPDKEAVAQHLQVAAECEARARRWDEEAARERDPARKRDLLSRAEYDRDMAQAERDLARSLETSTIVHTRTEWQNRQSTELVAKMKAELEEFRKDDQRLAAIPRLAAMVSGPEGQRLQAELQQRLHDALTAPDRGARLEQLHAQLKRVVTSQRDAELGRHEAAAAQADANLATAEGIKAGADAAFWAATYLVPGAGAVSLAYGVGVGYAEGGVVQAVETAARAYSQVVDVSLAAVHGALEVDEQGQRKGLGGAAEAAFCTAVLNKITGAISAKTTGLVQGGISSARLGGQGARDPIRPEAFKDSHERYREALGGARTPAERQAVEQRFPVPAARERMRAELAAITARHEANLPAEARRWTGGIDTSSPAYQQAQQAWQRDMAAARARYQPLENRMEIHRAAMAEAGLGGDAVTLSGGEPKSIMSDLDLTPSSAAAGARYAAALGKKGHQVLEFHDRWVVPGIDVTIWKQPTSGVDNPATASYEYSVLLAALPGSDKFPTRGGVEYTTGKGKTSDPEGAVISNFKKAQEAGLGGGGTTDLHVVGKSLDKALQIAGVPADPRLAQRAAAARAHGTPEEVFGTFGWSAADKAREQSGFLDQGRSAFGDALHASSRRSAEAAASLRQQLADARAQKLDATAEAIRLRLAAYEVSNRLTLQSLARRDPATIAAVLSRRDAPPPSGRGSGWLAEQLARDREALQRRASQEAPAVSLPGVGERCRIASGKVAAKRAGARPGTPEAAYLAQLEAALDRGATDPGRAVSEVRLVTGHELAEVLHELAPARGR